jgi:hypothetical protein
LKYSKEAIILLFLTALNMKKVLFFLFMVSLAACNKNKEHCWQVYDALGNEMGIVCDKTESEIQAAYGPFYDRADAPEFCWKVSYNNGTTGYLENVTEKMASYWFGNNSTGMEKVQCGYCQKWLTRHKGVLKSTGQFAYDPIKVMQYCDDTCSTIFPGRIILLRETSDSLIYHEFMQRQ